MIPKSTISSSYNIVKSLKTLLRPLITWVKFALKFVFDSFLPLRFQTRRPAWGDRKIFSVGAGRRCGSMEEAKKVKLFYFLNRKVYEDSWQPFSIGGHSIRGRIFGSVYEAQKFHEIYRPPADKYQKIYLQKARK